MTLQELQTGKRAAILALAQRHGASNVRIFGSVARGQELPGSDLDILIDLDPGRNLFDMGGLLEDLRELLNSRVDLVEARSLHPRIRARILAEAVPL